MKLTVIGCGYLGATHAACMAELGHEVLGVEVDDAERALLADGRAPFYEPGLADLLAKHVASGALRFTDSFEEAGGFADLHFLCVGTPQMASGLGADTGQVESAVRSLAPHLRRPASVVGKSTVPVGTAAQMADLLASLAPVGADAELVWNPEFLREGFAVGDTLEPDRVVLGVAGARSEAALRDFYAPLTDGGTPIVVTDFATAELVKVAANAFLATKVSFINAVGEVCDAAGADVVALADAIGHDARIGRRFLNAGIGFGGGCLPKDIRAFVHRAGELGVEDAMSFLRQVDDINQRQRERAHPGRDRRCSAARWRAGGSACGERRSSPTPTTSATPPPSTSPGPPPPPRRPRHRLRPPGHRDRPGPGSPAWAHADSAIAAADGAEAPSSTSPSGRSSASIDIAAVTDVVAHQADSSTAATSSTSPPGATTAGRPAASATARSGQRSSSRREGVRPGRLATMRSGSSSSSRSTCQVWPPSVRCST